MCVTLNRGRELSAARVQAIVARDNARSIQMLLLEGFVQVRAFDPDYVDYAAGL
jgi:hypothetical protein